MGLSQTETNKEIVIASIKALHDSLMMMDMLFEKKVTKKKNSIIFLCYQGNFQLLSKINPR